jgi:integrase
VKKRKSKKLETPEGRASILQRTDGLWVGRFTTKDPNTGLSKRLAVYGSTEQEARVKVLAALRSGPQIALQGRGQTLEQYVAHWLKVKTGQGLAAKTLERYRGLLEDHTLPTIGKVRLGDLTRGHVDALMAAKRAEGKIGPNSINKIRQTLTTVLFDAKRDKLVTDNAAADARKVADDHEEVGILDGEQAKRLLEIGQTHDDGAIWTVALCTAMRQAELVGLRWSDVDIADCDQATVTVRHTIQRSPTGGAWLVLPPKTKKSRRTLPLPAMACEALQRQAALQRAARVKAGPDWQPALDSTGQPILNLVFTNTTGGPLMGNLITRRLRKALRDGGLPTNVHFHSLRHSTASLLQAKGVPARVAQDILGHTDVRTTENLYIHVGKVQHREAMTAITEALRG